MPAYRETRQLPYTPRELFDLVIDIERYPEFLPWCRGARILERHPDYVIGELIISFSHLTERYSSRIVATPPAGDQPGTIAVSLVKGPFSHLSNDWRFAPSAGGTELSFAVDFAFRSRVLNGLIGSLFARASEKMVAAFTARAVALYGR